jgi:hypothetical protein
MIDLPGVRSEYKASVIHGRTPKPVALQGGLNKHVTQTFGDAGWDERYITSLHITLEKDTGEFVYWVAVALIIVFDPV